MDNIENNKENIKHKRVVSIIIGVLIFISSLVLGLSIGLLIGSRNRLTTDEKKLLEEYRILKEEWLYGGDISSSGPEALANGFSNTDPYTIYTNTEEEQGLEVSRKGFGISYRYSGKGIYVREVHQGPSKNKLIEGDIITGCKRNDEYKSFSVSNINEISSFLSDTNYENSEYKFSVLRGNENLEISIYRAEYEVNQVVLITPPEENNNFTMAVRIDTFLGNPYYILDGMINNYYSKSKINKLIIDLRENGGGYVNQADKIAKLFVEKGTFIYSLVDKDNKVIDESYQNNEPKYKIPSFSLILDENSASASELLTLALRAGTNCKIYGFNSYGKGISQSFHYFSDGSVLRYTSAKVYGPKRKSEINGSDDKICIHGIGIKPDVEYSTKYTFMIEYRNIEDLLYISEYNQQYVLKSLNLLDSNIYPNSYSSTMHFNNLIELYGTNNSINVYKDDGKLSKDVNDQLAFDTCNLYLHYYDLLFNEVLNDR